MNPHAVHADSYVIRTMRGHYVKDDNGIYRQFKTKNHAQAFAESNITEDVYVVPVRIAITPSFTGRPRHVVAIHKTGPKEVSQANQTYL